LTPLSWGEEAVSQAHDRDAFDCGDEALNSFLRRYARQSHEAGGAKTFLAVDENNGAILGFYSLAPASVAFARVPQVARKGLAQHDVPGFRLARIAVSLNAQGQGLGAQLLLAAGRRCLRAASEVGGVILVIDAKSERAAEWYAKLGATPLIDAPMTLVLPLATIAAALRSAGKL
jgi:GNAT superfamily N-acetyltransferase